MLKKLYYKLSSIFYKIQIHELGHNCKLRMNGRIIGGKYVHFSDYVEIEKNWIIAVYPEYAGVRNPVTEDSTKGVWIGSKCSFNRSLTIYCADKISIGNNCLFGSNVLISDNDHGINPISNQVYRFQPLTSKPVEIGDDCWIAEDVKILKGAIIGEKTIVAANSVVKGQFPGYCILAGCPARIVKRWDFKEEVWKSEK